MNECLRDAIVLLFISLISFVLVHLDSFIFLNRLYPNSGCLRRFMGFMQQVNNLQGPPEPQQARRIYQLVLYHRP